MGTSVTAPVAAKGRESRAKQMASVDDASLSPDHVGHNRTP
jgi:hypothetical protein